MSLLFSPLSKKEHPDLAKDLASDPLSKKYTFMFRLFMEFQVAKMSCLNFTIITEILVLLHAFPSHNND